MLEITNDNYQKEVIESDMPVMLDCFAVWCGPCKMMAPVVEEMAEKYAGKVKVCKADVDQADQVAKVNRVMSIPTFLFFKNGEVVNTIVGGMDPASMDKAIAALL